MADKRSVDDLEAELAQIEAELAALEGRAPPPRKANPKKETPAPAPAPDTVEADEAPSKRKLPFGFGRKQKETAEQPAASEPATEEAPSKPRFGLPFGKKKGADEAPEAADASAASTKPRLALPFGRGGKEEPAEPPAVEALVETRSDAPPAVARAPAVALVEDEPAGRKEAVPVTDASNWRREDGAWVRVVPETPAPVVRRVLDEEGGVVREEPATQEDLDQVTGVKAERGIGKLLGGKSLKMPAFGRFGRKPE